MSRPHLLDVYAITLKNPWAHLVAHYGKDVENRNWMPHEAVDQLLIHAGKGSDPLPEFIRSGEWGDPHTSAIVAVANLGYACSASRWTDTVICGCGEWAQPGQCHWKFGEIWPLPEPVPASGRQGLWRPDRDVLDAVRNQLAAVAS